MKLLSTVLTVFASLSLFSVFTSATESGDTTFLSPELQTAIKNQGVSAAFSVLLNSPSVCYPDAFKLAINEKKGDFAFIMVRRGLVKTSEETLISALENRLLSFADRILGQQLKYEEICFSKLLSIFHDDQEIKKILLKHKMYAAAYKGVVEEVKECIEEAGGFSQHELDEAFQKALYEHVELAGVLLRNYGAHPTLPYSLNVALCSRKGATLELLLEDPTVYAHLSSTGLDKLREALRMRNDEKAMLLVKHVPVCMGYVARNLILEYIIGRIYDLREHGPAEKFPKAAEDYLQKWSINFDFSGVFQSFMVAPTEPISEMEKFIANFFFDSNFYCFSGFDASLQDIVWIYQRYKDMLLNSRDRLTSSQNRAKVDEAILLFGDLIDSANHMHTDIKNLDKETKERRERVKDERREWITTKLQQMQPGEKLHVPLGGCNHVSIGVFEKTDDHSGTFTIFNSGDGTSTKSEADETRQVMFEIFKAVNIDWFIEMIVNRAGNTDRTYRENTYPPEEEYDSHYISNTTIQGQRGPTCMVLSARLFLLCTVGRLVYSEIKNINLLDLLSSVYTGLASAPPNTCPNISFLGQTFSTNFLPVWVFVRQTLLFENQILRHIRKLDYKPVVYVSDTGEEAGTADYQLALVETKQLCLNMLKRHVAEFNLDLPMED